MSLRAIAQELGVSSTAVSLALKNSPRVSANLRQQVLAIAQRNGYIPNARVTELRAGLRQTNQEEYRATLGLMSLYEDENPGKRYPHLQLVIEGAKRCASMHGYQLKPVWLKQPGMSVNRLAGILHARSIRALLCLGSEDTEEPFPPELKHCAIVTIATSIPDRLHRVCSHFNSDASLLTEQLFIRGYRRPGLVMLKSGDRRSAFRYSSTFLGWQERVLPYPPIPLLRLETWHRKSFDDWFDSHQPDVLVLHQHADFIDSMQRNLAQRKLTVPDHLGLALLDLNPDPDRYSGILQNFPLMGATAMEILIGRIILNDFGPPENPKLELVMGKWNEGKSLRPVQLDHLPDGLESHYVKDSNYQSLD